MTRVVTFLLLLLPVAGLSATQPDLIASGRAAMRLGEFSRAVALYEKAVAANPNDAEAHYLLGGAYGREAQQASIIRQPSLAKKAKHALETAIRLDPGHMQARFALIDFYMIAPAIVGGSEEKALQQAEEIRKRDAVEGHRAFARIHARQKNTERAHKELLEAVRTHPDSARARYHLGSFLLGEKNYDAARAEFEKAQELAPAWLPPLYRIGQHTALAGGDFSRGEASLKRYLSREPADDEPSHAAAWYWLGVLYEKQGRKADAKRCFSAGLKLSPKDKSIQEGLKRVS